MSRHSNRDYGQSLRYLFAKARSLGKNVWTTVNTRMSENRNRELSTPIPPDDEEYRYYRNYVCTLTTVFLVGGLFFLVFLGTGLVVCVIWSLASFVSGCVIGFLFGIPKTVDSGRLLSNARNRAEEMLKSEPNTKAVLNHRFIPNTNMEEISDWLTKIIVGLTLVEFRQIVSWFREAATTLAQGIDSEDPARRVAVSEGIMVYFGAVGFLSGFLLTRLSLAVAMRASDELSLRKLSEQMVAIEGKVENIGRSMGADARQSSESMADHCATDISGPTVSILKGNGTDIRSQK